MAADNKFFASDNWSGAHPLVLEALRRANVGHEPAYGLDSWTARAEEGLRAHFGAAAGVYLVMNGTAANVLSLRALLKPYQAAICAAGSHLEHHECGAPEAIAGCKLLPLPTADGKLRPANIDGVFLDRSNVHVAQPRVLSITQSTELGTVYTPAEIRELAEYAHARGMLLHMDGARLCNAAVSLNLPLRALTTDCGLDVLSFGGSKNGLFMAEAVILMNSDICPDFEFYRKQSMQLASKMRFIAAQFEAFLEEDLWRKNASKANSAAATLAAELAKIPEVKVTRPVEANAVFCIFPKRILEPLRQRYKFYIWDQASSEARLMCSFDHENEDIAAFIAGIKQALCA